MTDDGRSLIAIHLREERVQVDDVRGWQCAYFNALPSMYLQREADGWWIHSAPNPENGPVAAWDTRLQRWELLFGRPIALPPGGILLRQLATAALVLILEAGCEAVDAAWAAETRVAAELVVAAGGRR